MRKRSILVLAATAMLWGAVGVARGQPLDLPPDLSGDREAQGFADLLFAHGMVHLVAGDYREALPFFEKAVGTWPKDRTYTYFTGICRLRLGLLDAAIAALNEALPPASSRIPEARIRYELGAGHYLKGEVDGAEDELRTSLRLDDGNAWAHFYLGLVLFARGKQDEAFSEFKTASALDPSLAADGSYYLGIAAYRRGDLDAARRYFQAVTEGAPPAELAASARRWLETTETPEEAAAPPRGELRVEFFVESDDNPGRLNETLPFLVVESDARSVIQFRGAHQALLDRNGWNLGLVLNGHSSRHDDFDVLDLAGAQGLFQVAWGSDPLGFVNGPLGYVPVGVGETRFGFIFQAGSTYFELDGDSFRRDHEAAASFLVHEPGFGKTQFDLVYDDRTFFPLGLQPLTGDATTARIGQYFILGGRADRYLRLALAQTYHSTELDALDRDTTQFLAELALPLSRRWTVFLYGERFTDDYDETSIFVFGEEREDTQTGVVATAVLGLTPHFYATFRYGWTELDARPDFLSYDRTIGSAGITWHW